jgi:hypothetical protein
VLKRIAMAKHGHPGYMLSVTFFSVCAVAISAWIAFLSGSRSAYSRVRRGAAGRAELKSTEKLIGLRLAIL